MDIQVGDIVTYKNINEPDYQARQKIMINEDDIAKIHSCIKESQIEILKIERPKYEVVEEKKELLTEEEREFLKLYIKIIKSLNNGQIISIRKQSGWIVLKLKTELEYQADIGSKFKNMEDCKKYNFSELGLEEN